METLILKSGKSTQALQRFPYATEDQFERDVFATPLLLDEVFLLKRQIRGGNKPGIPDIIGVDNDGNICIVEMKNVPVDEKIIPQVLQYAFWAEKNRDSIKALWLECDDKPDDIFISWEEYEVRIVILAPRILASALDLVKKITYQVDLIEVKRWVDDANQYLLVNRIESEAIQKFRPTVGLSLYDEEFYKKQYNSNSAVAFLKFCDQVFEHVQSKGWEIERKFNKHYCGFKVGAFNAFGVKWIGTKTFALFFKLSENAADGVKLKMTRYDKQWKEAVYYIEPDSAKVQDFDKLFTLAYDKLAEQ